MQFEGDAFISYAHLDNVELVEGRKGWVANLHRALEVRVGQLLGKSPHIWRDPKLSGNDLFADTLLEKLKQVALLVTVVSPRYLKSEWTIRELNEFWHAAEDQGGIQVNNKARVFKVLKTPVPLDRTPPELRALIGYEFFKVDPETGKVRELDEVFGHDAHRDFWLKLDDLAHDIVELLETIENPEQAAAAAQAAAVMAADAAAKSPLPAGAPPASASPAPAAAPQLSLQPQPSIGLAGSKKEAVYLAETTSDLRDQREAIRRDLQQQGYTVLPDRTIPHVFEEAAAAIVEDLGRSRMSIHPIGRNFSMVPEGGTQSMVEMQHELATLRASQGSFARLLWLPSGIKVDDERQQKVVERLRMDPRIHENADLLETFFEDLRTTMQDWLKKDRTPAAVSTAPAELAGGAAPRLYLVAEQRDGALLGPWLDGLFAEHLEVIQPIFEGDEAEIREYHEENLAHCDGVLILYGAGNELWLRRKLREIQKAAGYGRTKPQPPIAICLVGPRTPEKERFRTHEASVVPGWDGFVLEPLGLFIAQLKAGGSV
ncbi:MAG: hypothetical protein A3H97_17820 [Acidobacteria bacterium RIFCSPLOWO2_02_FULL_65_29]|nr:MAG: hypothetical protein A3H97_17820 [Acidobacteria bacterium RIFCSPLOWO2_02_FULL_65_29]